MKAWQRLSLRARLSLLNAFLLILSLVVLGWSSYWNIWQLFVDSKGSHLRARAKPIIEHWLSTNNLDKPRCPGRNFNAGNALSLACDLTSRDAVAIVVDRKGEVLASGRRLPEEPEPPPPDKTYLKRALAGENEITHVVRVKDTRMLVLLIPLRPLPASPCIFGVVQMSAPLDDINQILFRHGSMLLMLALVLLFAGSVAGFWLTGLSLRGLRDLLDTCNQIGRGNFSVRARVRNRWDETGQLASAFNRMLDELEAALAAQKRFVANAAHELLTPLTGLRGSLEVLLRGAQDDPVASARLLKGMYREVNRLVRLCEQLLGMSRLESSYVVKRQPVILPDFFSDFRSQAKSIMEGRRLVIRQGPHVTVRTDPDLMQQVLFNILSNAIRYSPPDAPIQIGWRLLPGQVEIQVADQGEGMDPRTLSRVFEPFFQGKSDKSPGEHGLGLGLPLAKSMVEALGGSIRIRSKKGRGTTVFLTLPL